MIDYNVSNIVNLHITVYNNSEWTVSTLDSEVTACLYLEYVCLIFRRCNSQSNLQLRQLCNSQPGRELPCGNSIPANTRPVESSPVFLGVRGIHFCGSKACWNSPQLSHLVQLSQPLANSLGSRVCKRSRCFWVEGRDGWMCRWQSWGNKRSTGDAVMEVIFFESFRLGPLAHRRSLPRWDPPQGVQQEFSGALPVPSHMKSTG